MNAAGRPGGTRSIDQGCAAVVWDRRSEPAPPRIGSAQVIRVRVAPSPDLWLAARPRQAIWGGGWADEKLVLIWLAGAASSAGFCLRRSWLESRLQAVS